MSNDVRADKPAGLSSPLASEIVVIGSGPGGSMTACLLAEAGKEVLLVEEGPFLQSDSCVPFSRDEMVQKYRNGGLTVALGKPKVAYVEGRCVGGGSEINAGLYYRTPPEVLAEWRREFGVAALSEQEMCPHFEAIEADLGVSYLPGQAPEASLKLHHGAESLGWQSQEVPRWFKYDAGSSPNAGIKQSMTQSLLPRALQAGCRLLPDTRVLRLGQSGGKWMLTAFSRSADSTAKRLRIEAETVFVAGGAIQTPALLQRSGITDNVGRTLRMHPTIKVTARFRETVNTVGMGVPVHQVKEFSPRYTFGCSTSTRPYLALAMVDHPAHAREVAENWAQCAIYYAMVRGGVGRVRCLPLFHDPLVRYALREEELAELATALQQLCRCLFAAGAVTLYPSVSQWSPLTTLADIEKLPRLLPISQTNLMTVHLFSSCPMGENRKRAAVDSFGRVHGRSNLYVADGSLLCGAPGVNPQGTIMALVRRNALRFLGRL